MEIREHALRVVTSTRLEDKITPPPSGPESLTDRAPGAALRIPEPGRPPDLGIVPAHRAKVPPIEGMPDPEQRARILHGFANHELQAAELFAWALLAFPDAPGELRRGLAAILDDEQRHTRMYIARCEALGLRFGEQPVSGYFWSKVEHIDTPAAFVCAMSLTFENANLDHTVDYAAAARAAGDQKTAAVVDQVHRDEVEHVRFGWTWLRRLKPEDQSMWDAFRANLTWPLRPLKAKGPRFHPEGRWKAGLEPEFVRLLEAERE